ncbi:hypothetical protein LQG66_13280 [Bradyrhizobium ontarionense]|uniref:Uncharacterized protein n=1 Tax=Bradyrhizobium ontarionense TaxID=2898149 RepID=A0ABY3RK03_9BRAD|nr:hypothetical protein [Bradyrhizobium sp. A19]UFZ07212.1 hypothetical protein LQG66_13280 [Bradyrhizobium sp. A19]
MAVLDAHAAFDPDGLRGTALWKERRDGDWPVTVPKFPLAGTIAALPLRKRTIAPIFG